LQKIHVQPTILFPIPFKLIEYVFLNKNPWNTPGVYES